MKFIGGQGGGGVQVRMSNKFTMLVRFLNLPHGFGLLEVTSIITMNF